MGLEGQEVVTLEGQGEEEEGTGSEGLEEEKEQEEEQKLVVYSSRLPPQPPPHLLVFLLHQLPPAPAYSLCSLLVQKYKYLHLRRCYQLFYHPHGLDILLQDLILHKLALTAAAYAYATSYVCVCYLLAT
jgi:hypothetical protein